jgi:hypothetical protein
VSAGRAADLAEPNGGEVGAHATVVQVVRAGDDFRVTTRAYELSVSATTARAVLRDPSGQVWSDLNLLSSLDRTDRRDETLGLGRLRLDEQSATGCRLTLSSTSSCWTVKETTLICTPDSVRVTVEVAGAGVLSDVRLLGGRAALLDGACGTFCSSTAFASVFVPTPTEPVQVVRQAASSAVLEQKTCRRGTG